MTLLSTVAVNGAFCRAIWPFCRSVGLFGRRVGSSGGRSRIAAHGPEGSANGYGPKSVTRSFRPRV